MRLATLALITASSILHAQTPPPDAPPEVVQAIRKRMPSFKLCFDEALQRKGHLEGKAVISFEVEGDGKAPHAKVTEDTIRDPEVGCCAALLVRRIKFDPPKRPPLSASFPFVFVNPNAPSPPPKNPPPPTHYCADLKAADGKPAP